MAKQPSGLVQPAVTHLPTFGQSGASLEITNQELVPDTLDPTTGYKYPSLGTMILSGKKRVDTPYDFIKYQI